MCNQFQIIDFALILAFFALSILISTLIIRHLFPAPKPKKEPYGADSKAPSFRAAGFWIGFCETILIFVFVISGQYSALAIIIGAKGFVRNDLVKENPDYYLLATLVNLCCGILSALAAQYGTGLVVVTGGGIF